MYIWNTIVGTIYVNQSPLEYNDRSKNEEIGVRMESQEVTCKAMMAWRGRIKDNSVNNMVRRPMTRGRLQDIDVPRSLTLATNLRTTRTVHDSLVTRSYD